MAAVMTEIAAIETLHRVHPLCAGQTMWPAVPAEAMAEAMDRQVTNCVATDAGATGTGGPM